MAIISSLDVTHRVGNMGVFYRWEQGISEGVGLAISLVS